MTKATIHTQAVQDVAAALNEISFIDVLNDGFIKEHTDFATFQNMIDSSGLHTAVDFDCAAWNAFVAAHSKFDSWLDMVSNATGESILKGLRKKWHQGDGLDYI